MEIQVKGTTTDVINGKFRKTVELLYGALHEADGACTSDTEYSPTGVRSRIRNIANQFNQDIADLAKSCGAIADPTVRENLQGPEEEKLERIALLHEAVNLIKEGKMRIVKRQDYDGAAHVRTIERLLMDHGTNMDGRMIGDILLLASSIINKLEKIEEK